MAQTTQFDSFYNSFTKPEKPEDFNIFWNNKIKELKKIKLDITSKKIIAKNKNFEVYDLTYKSFSNYTVKCRLYQTLKVENPQLMILAGDYQELSPFANYQLSSKMSYLEIELRGHPDLLKNLPKDVAKPSFMTEYILEPNFYYLTGVFLDYYRAVDMIRFCDFINCSEIICYGIGLGAAAAFFTACQQKNVKKVILNSPQFINLKYSQNKSQSLATEEINKFISTNHKQKKIIKQNLEYFDLLNFADQLFCSTLVICGFKDNFAPPACTFNLFHLLKAEKDIEIYPDQGFNPEVQNQFKKTLKWSLS